MAAASTAAPPPSGLAGLPGPLAALLSGWVVPKKSDPRWPFAALLTLYCVLGFLFFGFNRTPAQMLFIMGSGALLDVSLTWFVRREKVVPLSAWISCASLAILLNYSKHSLILFLPVLLAIGSKHLLTFEGRHFFNPSMFGVATALLLGNEVITAAPAYQWAGSSLTVTFFLVTAALMLFVFRIGRGWLVVSFLVFYALNTAIRAVVMRHHLPPEMLFIGTMTTPPFYLFTLYMITDPATSPKTPAMQLAIAFSIAAVDLVLHLKESVYTFFYAALIVASARYLYVHVKKLVREGPWRLAAMELDGRRLRGTFGVFLVAAVYFGILTLSQNTITRDPGFTMERIDVNAAGLGSEMSDILHQVDPRIQHIGKWVLSVGDAVAAGDVDNDGDVDLFLTSSMKRPEDRAALLLNDLIVPGGQGSAFHFTRLPLPALEQRVGDPKKHGLPGGATFVDWDGDGDLDLTVAWGFGKTRMLKNLLTETGAVSFVDVSEEVGVDEHTVSLAAVFFDVENDGDLDLFLLNATSPWLKDYTPPRPLNIFELPAPEYTDDRRMFHFMHDGWHDANNGGGQTLFLNDGAGHFQKQEGAPWGLTSTRWSLIATTADFNHDGFTDVYVANDFGPDELLLNEGGKHFRSIKGALFNEVGHDTYKGMNATQADFDRNGFLDVTVSNVHHALQAEGSMLWMVSENPTDPFVPRFSDEATQRGALNEHRFAWGAQAGDLDNDGWPDLVQANGMVDDRLDKSIPDGERKDYWYVNHKLMQSGPELHTYADMWGDLRGRTIYPNEARRAYLNLGDAAPGHFVDVAAQLGITDPDDSRGVLLSDLDNDGDLDVLVTNQHGPVSLYKSRLMQTQSQRGTAHFIDLMLVGAKANSHGVGARVTVSFPGANGQPIALVQDQHLLGGFAAQHDPRLHFGLGAAAGPVDVEVRWPGGAVTKAALPADGTHVVREVPGGG